MNNMKVVYERHYLGRDLFILEIDKKLLMVYRSSGLSGTGHEGKFLPFSGINTETNRLSSPILGYIFKEMYYNGCWINHKKNLDSFHHATKLMNNVKEFLKDLYPMKHKEHNTLKEITEFIKVVSKEIDEFIKDKEFLDLCTKEELNEKRISNRMVKSNTYLDKK